MPPNVETQDIKSPPALINARVLSSEEQATKDGQFFTVFVVTLTHIDGRTWRVKKRFSEFAFVRGKLIEGGYPGIAELPFPAKKLWGSSSTDTVNERQLLLDTWLGRVVQVLGLRSPGLCEFISVGGGELRRGRLPSAGSVGFDMSIVINAQPFDAVYTRHGELGRGAFSVVYLAVNKETGQKCACKVVDMTSAEYVPNEMEMEIRIGKLVSGHENTVNIIDVFRDDRYWYLVQELVMGGELFDIVIRRSEAREAQGLEDTRPYSEMDAALVLQQIIAGVAHCHSKGVVHRDLKPENVLCVSEEPDALIKLGDFGLSALVPPNGKLTVSSGTPEYVAPEVIVRPSVGYNESCDIWSIGVIMYILLCGFPPFYGSSPKQILNQVRSKEIADTPDFFPDVEWQHVSVEARTLILRMLSRDPAARPTAAELMSHPWFTANTNSTPIPTIPRLKRFNAKRKFRACCYALKATNRMAGLIQSMKATHAAVRFAKAYTLEHVENLYDAFDDLSERTGNATHVVRGDFISVLNTTLELGGDSALAVAHWDAFSVEGLGLNYQEYILALSTMFARTADETLKFAFEIIDSDGSGEIEMSEFCGLVKAMMARTQQHLDADSIEEVSQREFAAADTNQDGVLSIDEFVEAGKQQLQLRKYFSSLDRLCKDLA